MEDQNIRKIRVI